MVAIVYDNLSAGFAEGGQILAAWAPTDASDGFDNAQMRIDFKGAGEAFTAAFPKGKKATDGKAMYISGVTIERVSPGYTTGTVFAKGFWDDPPDELSTLNTNFGERLWPFENGGQTYIFDGRRAGQSTLLNPTNANKPFRVRQILLKGILQRQGAIILTNSAATWAGPPKPTDPRPQALDNAVNNLADPLLSTKIGWVQQGCTPRIVARLGAITLLAWQDSWEWFDRESE